MKIWFIVPPTPKPSGGINKLLEFADLLSSNGRSVEVLSDYTQSQQAEWMVNRSLQRPHEIEVDGLDLLVIPEVLADRFKSVTGVSKLIANQNTFLATPACYQDTDVVGHLVVSEYSREHISRISKTTKTWRIRYSIDQRLFRPSKSKNAVVAYMPRKLPNHLDNVLLATSQDALISRHWNFVPIHGMSHNEVAAVLREATVFLSTSWQEGFGLPAAEAMACGAYAVGYPGQAGREFFLPEFAHPVPDGDVSAFVEAACRVLSTAASDPIPFLEKGSRAASYISRTYTHDHQLQDLLAAFSEAEEIVRARATSASTIRLPRLRGSRIRIAAYHARKGLRGFVTGAER